MDSYASLPQKPRSPAEDQTFRRALKIMADVYYSPMGTCVLQAAEVPTRPPSFDGVVLACDLANGTTEAALREALAPYGDIRLVEMGHSAGAARVSFATHDQADLAVVEGSASLPGGGGYLCLEYNDRAYECRGWCVAEEVFATECLLYLRLPGSFARSKAIRISHDGHTPPADLQPTPRTNVEVLERLDRAVFTGKGDARNVTSIIIAHDLRLKSLLQTRKSARNG